MTYERELIGYAIGSLFIFKMRKGAKYLWRILRSLMIICV